MYCIYIHADNPKAAAAKPVAKPVSKSAAKPAPKPALAAKGAAKRASKELCVAHNLRDKTKINGWGQLIKHAQIGIL